MRYSLSETLPDYGFSFLERLHSPIFLLHENGTLKKANEAGRKLLHVAHINARQLEGYVKALLSQGVCPPDGVGYRRLSTVGKQIKVISRRLANSDYTLVELRR